MVQDGAPLHQRMREGRGWERPLSSNGVIMDDDNHSSLSTCFITFNNTSSSFTFLPNIPYFFFLLLLPPSHQALHCPFPPSGSAGTGKSFLLQRLLGSLQPDTTFITASTGIAASHIGGSTLHSFAGEEKDLDTENVDIKVIIGRT